MGANRVSARKVAHFIATCAGHPPSPPPAYRERARVMGTGLSNNMGKNSTSLEAQKPAALVLPVHPPPAVSARSENDDDPFAKPDASAEARLARIHEPTRSAPHQSASKWALERKDEVTLHTPRLHSGAGSTRIASVDMGVASRNLKWEDTNSSWQGEIGGEQVRLLLVADGHGGKVVAQMCAEHVLGYIRQTADKDACGASLRNACYEAFRKIDADVCARRDINSGSTLTVVCLNVSRAELTVANVGDSAVYLVPYEYSSSSSSSGEVRSSSSSRSSNGGKPGGDERTAGGDGNQLARLDSSASDASSSTASTYSCSTSSSASASASTPHGLSRLSARIDASMAQEVAAAEGRQPTGQPTAHLFAGARAPHCLSEDHRLERSEDECRRVIAAGGKIARACGVGGGPEGPLRAWPGGLAVARGIGDSDCGRYISPEPAVRTLPLPLGGASLVLCSDGVWDSLSIDVVSDLILRGLKRRPGIVKPHLIAEQIVAKAAVARGALYDDTTCMLLHMTTEGSLHAQLAMRHNGPSSVHGSGPRLLIGRHGRERGSPSLSGTRSLAAFFAPRRVIGTIAAALRSSPAKQAAPREPRTPLKLREPPALAESFTPGGSGHRMTSFVRIAPHSDPHSESALKATPTPFSAAALTPLPNRLSPALEEATGEVDAAEEGADAISPVGLGEVFDEVVDIADESLGGTPLPSRPT